MNENTEQCWFEFSVVVWKRKELFESLSWFIKGKESVGEAYCGKYMTIVMENSIKKNLCEILCGFCKEELNKLENMEFKKRNWGIKSTLNLKVNYLV